MGDTSLSRCSLVPRSTRLIAFKRQKFKIEVNIKGKLKLFNLIAREDARLSLSIANATKKDSASMKTIALMTMIFLPGTFFAALFAIPTLDWEAPGVIQGKFWVYWAFTIPSTLIIGFTWYWPNGEKIFTRRESVGVVSRED